MSNLRPRSVWCSDLCSIGSGLWFRVANLGIWGFGLGLQRNEKGDRVFGEERANDMAGICLGRIGRSTHLYQYITRVIYSSRTCDAFPATSSG